jgi:hypothetical protein
MTCGLKFGAPVLFDHPQVGEMTLNRERLHVSGVDGLQLVVYHPDAGSEDAHKLALLLSASLPAAEPDRTLRPSR